MTWITKHFWRFQQNVKNQNKNHEQTNLNLKSKFWGKMYFKYFSGYLHGCYICPIFFGSYLILSERNLHMIFSPLLKDSLLILIYSTPDTMWHLPQTELILTNFYINPNCSLALWKYLIKMNPKLCWGLKEIWWSYGGNNYLVPENPIYGYLTLWLESQKHDIIKMRTYTSSYT